MISLYSISCSIFILNNEQKITNADNTEIILNDKQKNLCGTNHFGLQTSVPSCNL